ncbi:MAG: cation:proton antiporter [Psychromonas sp.]|nr:cation:proton antiporter [Psychromonas sp.]
MLQDILLLLLFAIINVIIFRKMKFSNIIAYLFTGFIVGPSLFDILGSYHEIELIAEFGLVFLMFSLGLEFSINKLMAMRRAVFGIGALQVTVSFFLFYAINLAVGMTWQQAFTISCVLSLSSTAIIIKELTDRQQLHSRKGRLAVAILLFQDLAIVPFLIAIPIIAVPFSDVSLLSSISYSFLKGAFAIFVLLSVGRWILPRFFDEIATLRFDEIFTLSSLFIVLLAAAFTHMLGLSMALGAFLAGMMLAESHYKHQLASDIRPFKDILMAMFFITIGTLLNVNVLSNNFLLLLILVSGVIIAKAFTITIAALMMKEKLNISLGVGIALSQMGEFGFILLALGTKYSILDEELTSLLIATGVISMTLTPLLIKYSHKIIKKVLHHSEEIINVPQILPKNYYDHTIICGYGCIGQIATRFLKAELLPFIVLDRDPLRVKEAQEVCENVKFGDATRRDILLIAGIEKAKLVIITFDNLDQSLSLIATIKAINSNIKILVRTKNDNGLSKLKEAGATEVIHERLERRLIFVAHMLDLSGISREKILLRLDKERKLKYKHLQGFYYGQESLTATKESYNVQLYAFILEANTEILNTKILEYHFHRVTLMSLHRENGKEVVITRETRFQIGDHLLLQGYKTDLLIAEKKLKPDHDINRTK